MNLNKSLEKELFFELLLFFGGISLVCFFYQTSFFLTTALIIVWFIALAFWHKKEDLVFFFVGATIGGIAEIFLVSKGVWKYNQSSFLAVPFWVPILWGLASTLIRRLSGTILKIIK